jgi:hypothetical protein
MLNRAKWQMSRDVSRFHVAASPSEPEKTEWELNEDLAFVPFLAFGIILKSATSNLSTFGCSISFTRLGEMVPTSLLGIVRGQFQ